MELIFFIVLGAILLAMAVSDKSASNVANRQFEEKTKNEEQDLKQFEATVVDIELEHELQDFIYDNVTPLSKRKYNDDYIGATSQELKKRLSDIPVDIQKSIITQKELLLALMAKQGKIPKNMALHGISCIGDNCTTPGRRVFERQRKFLMWVDEELQSHGVEPMLFKRISEPLQIMDLAKDRTTSHMGKYCWWSGRRYVS